MLLLPGCGGEPKGEVNGKVTLNGEPVLTGLVTAVNEKGDIVGSASISEGDYKLFDLPLGTYTVTVQTQDAFGNPVGIPGYTVPPANYSSLPPEAKKGIAKEQPEAVQKAVKNVRPIPLKYASAKESGLKVTAGPTPTTFNIEMKGKGETPKLPK